MKKNTNIVYIEDGDLVSLRIKKVIAKLKGEQVINSQQDIVNLTGYNKSSVSQAVNNKNNYLTIDFIDKFCSVFPMVNKNYIINGIEPELNSETPLPKSDLKPKVYGGSIPVRLVENKAKAGWSDGYYSDEYLKDMPVVIVEADENYKGNYMAFEVEGDSMEPDYIEGNIVICREVQRHLWQSKLHYKDWDFVIAHAKDGIYLKEIVHHDVEKGVITCRSLNPRYKDFKVDLREVAHLYNVVETRQQGRNKRWNRVRDFFE